MLRELNLIYECVKTIKIYLFISNVNKIDYQMFFQFRKIIKIILFSGFGPKGRTRYLWTLKNLYEEFIHLLVILNQRSD